MPSEKAAVIQQGGDALYDGSRRRASELAKENCPLLPRAGFRRSYTKYQSLQVFPNDGFIDK